MGTRVLAAAIVIATGARPAVPPIEGTRLGRVPHQRDPVRADVASRSLAVLGGGPIGVEMAQAFSRLGSRVTIVEAASPLLPREEPLAAHVLAGVFAKLGITMRTGSAVEKVEQLDRGGGVRLASRRRVHRRGRRPPGGRRADDRRPRARSRRGWRRGRRSRVRPRRRPAADHGSGGFAAGDVAEPLQFTHVAYETGRIAATQRAGPRPRSVVSTPRPFPGSRSPIPRWPGSGSPRPRPPGAGGGWRSCPWPRWTGPSRRADRGFRQDHRRSAPGAAPRRPAGGSSGPPSWRPGPARCSTSCARHADGHVPGPAGPHHPRLSDLVHGGPAGRRPALRRVRRAVARPASATPVGDDAEIGQGRSGTETADVDGTSDEPQRVPGLMDHVRARHGQSDQGRRQAFDRFVVPELGVLLHVARTMTPPSTTPRTWSRTPSSGLPGHRALRRRPPTGVAVHDHAQRPDQPDPPQAPRAAR